MIVNRTYNNSIYLINDISLCNNEKVYIDLTKNNDQIGKKYTTLLKNDIEVINK